MKFLLAVRRDIWPLASSRPLYTSSSSSSFSSAFPAPCLPQMQSMSFQGAIDLLNGLLARKPADAALVGGDPPHPVIRRDGPRTLARMANFQRMFTYIQTLDLEEPISRLNVIHVAGTKGKGSTCAFSESILRSSGYRTGLFTSPHLIDIRERFRFNGVEVSEELFTKHFWWCWSRLKARTAEGVPMPGFFQFVTLLALKMFTSESVDVAIMEVGLGGRCDATNVVKSPVVCGITSLGLDHMEILGNTLADIAREKAGIFKAGVPAFSVPQKSEAMEVLQKEAENVAISLKVSDPLSSYYVQNIHLGLEGSHQRINAALAVELCATWEKKCGLNNHWAMVDKKVLPDPYLQGLANVCWPGRAQVIHDKPKDSFYGTADGRSLSRLRQPGLLTFYLDGAHSPESMEACANWFCEAARSKTINNPEEASANGYAVFNETHQQKGSDFWGGVQQEKFESSSLRVLLFNCMPKRDPKVLLPPVINICSQNGLPIHMAIFVPCLSNTKSIDIRSLADLNDSVFQATTDLSWQKNLQEIWESLREIKNTGSKVSYLKQGSKNVEHTSELDTLRSMMKRSHGLCYHQSLTGPSSVVVSSLTAAVDLLRSWARGSPDMHIQVLVTGSLYLVGDLFRTLKQ